MAEQQAKAAAVSEWMATGGAYSAPGKGLRTLANSASTGRYSINPQCVVNPSTGQCAYWVTVSTGGEYQEEPSSELHWCGPGASTAVAMHWNYSAVVDFGNYTVRADPVLGGYYETLSGAQAWMGYFAQGMYVPQLGTYGVQPYPNEASNSGQLADGLDTALGTSYYIPLHVTQESSLFGNATYDMWHDGHPMMFVVNAEYLPEWRGFQHSQLDHWIMGYAYGYYSGASADSTNRIYYADTASNQGSYVVNGDYSMTYDSFYFGPYSTYSSNDPLGWIVV